MTPRDSEAWSLANVLAIWPSEDDPNVADNTDVTVTVTLYEAGGSTLGSDELTIRVDNRRPEVRITDVKVGTSSVLNSCDVVDLGGAPLSIEFTARHLNSESGPADFLHKYRLWKIPNDDRPRHRLAGATYSCDPTCSPIGVAGEELIVDWLPEDGNCSYIFRLYASSRTTDGYHRFRWRHDEQSFYVLRTTP